MAQLGVGDALFWGMHAQLAEAVLTLRPAGLVWQLLMLPSYCFLVTPRISMFFGLFSLVLLRLWLHSRLISSHCAGGKLAWCMCAAKHASHTYGGGGVCAAAQ